MICETCHGDGYVYERYTIWNKFVPCPECGGCGIQHCCEGLHEQPTAEDL